MMKASELMIGNYINTPEGLRIVDTITKSLVDCGSFFIMDEINPISLTEEWLTNFGFVKKDYDTYGIKIHECNSEDFYIGWFIINLQKYYGKIRNIEIPMGDYRNNTSAKIKYVHQLQNLYFALTGEELTIKN